MRRWVPVAIALTAAAAQIAGAPALAFYLMLLAVPVLAGCALSLFGELLDSRAAAMVRPSAMLEPLLSAVALFCVVAGAATCPSSPPRTTPASPRTGCKRCSASEPSSALPC